MKRIITLAMLVLGVCGSAHGTDALYINYGTVYEAPQVDATAFDNRGNMIFTGTLATNGPDANFVFPFLFECQNTRFYTNSGVMEGSQGFRFESVLKSKNGTYSRGPAGVFTNSGTISGVDGYSGQFYYSGYWTASYLLVNSTNIGNSGTMVVGDQGLLQLKGRNVDLRNGILVAGDSTGGNGSDYTSGRGYLIYTNDDNGGFKLTYTYANPSRVYDLDASITTNNIDLAGYATDQPLRYYTVSTNGQYGHWVYAYQYGTNVYVNIVYVRTNNMDSNLSVDVRFLPDLYLSSLYITNDNNASEAIVRFAAAGTDVTTGAAFTNTAYLLDNGQAISNAVYYTNIIWDGSMRPSSFEITTSTPYEWYASIPSNYTFSAALIYPGFGYDTRTLDVRFTGYAAQIGRNSESINGLFGYNLSYLDLSDPTNQPARIEITSDNLKLGNARIRAEGLLSVTATNLIPGGTSYLDAGSLIYNIGNTNSALILSNTVPYTHVRCYGDIYAYSMDWTNSSGAGANNYRFHVLVVDHSFQGSQTPTMRNLTLHGSSVEVDDPVKVVRDCTFDTTNLTLKANVTLALDAGDIDASVMPRMKDLLVETNGYLIASNSASFGSDTVAGFRSMTNRGTIAGAVMHIKSKALENAGVLSTFTAGVIEISADSLRLSSNTIPLLDTDPVTGLPVYKPVPGVISSGSGITITANSLFADYSSINNGIYFGGNLTLTVSNSLSDGVASTPGTNNVIKNTWQVKNGITMTRKPIQGDLFGTKIILTSIDTQQPVSTWAAVDYGATVRGFSNNLSIGHLVLDCQSTNASFKFFGASTKSAMYVDYLELKSLNASSSGYSTTLQIDPSLTIYFADCNVDAEKLTNLFQGRVVWVPNFAGPNSSSNVLAHVNGTITNVLVNRSLVTALDIDSNGNGIPNKFDPYPFDGVVLSTPIIGNGSIIPNLDGRALTLGNTYSLTAVPSAGSSFTGWTWTADSGNPNIKTNNATISFVMQPNLVLKANFTAFGEYGNITSVGFGSVTPNQTTNILIYGHTYTVKAVPTAGNLFAGWSGSSTNTAASLTFTMQPGYSLVANFVTNQYLAMKGTYNGLFLGTNSTDSVWNSGAITVTANEKGAASVKLTMPSGTYSFNTQFSATGAAVGTVKRSAASSLTVTLVINTSDASETITGSVSEGTNWSSPVYGEIAAYDGAKKISPAKGNYTLAIIGDTSKPTTPAGDAFGTVAVTAAGKVTWAGKLPDNTQITPSTTIGKSGLWPFFYTRSGRDVLIGWLTVSTNDYSTVSGSITWARKSASTGAYKSGFTNSFDSVGSSYVVPTSGTGLSIEVPALTVNGADFGSDTTFSMSFTAKTLTYSSLDGKTTVKVTPKTGLVTGKVYNSITGKTAVLNGLVLQQQNAIRGCFYSGTVSGEAFLNGQ